MGSDGDGYDGVVFGDTRGGSVWLVVEARVDIIVGLVVTGHASALREVESS